MADGSKQRHMKRRNGAVRLAGRVAVLMLCLVLVTLIGIQFARVIAENIAMARSLSEVRGAVATLRHQEAQQRLIVRRLSDPQGAIPAIHERLRLVAPNETIIYIKRVPSPHP